MFKKFYLSLVALLGLCGAVAVGNYNMTQGAGTAFGSIVVGGTVHYAQQLICDYVTPSQCANVSAGGAISTADAAVLAAVNSSIPAGTNLIGDVNLRQGGTALSTTNGIYSNLLQGNAVLSITNPSFGRAVAGATGGASTTGNIAANNTTAVVVKGSAGTLYGAQVYGIGSAPAYLKIYNATSATCGSGTPVKRLMIPAASTAANGAGSNISFGEVGVDFSTGITYCITTGITDADTTSPAASTYLVNLDWK